MESLRISFEHWKKRNVSEIRWREINLPEKSSRNEVEFENEQMPSLNDLNDDSILQILKFRELESLVEFSDCCMRFRQITRFYCLFDDSHQANPERVEFSDKILILPHYHPDLFHPTI